MKKHLGLLLLGFALIGCAKAPITTTTNTSTATLSPGGSGEAVVILQITNGYHVNANPPSQAYLKATELELRPAEGISVQFLTYPDPLIKKFAFSETPLKVYEGETTVKVRLKADKKTQPGTHNLSAQLRVQACDDKVCYAPGALELTVPVNVK